MSQPSLSDFNVTPYKPDLRPTALEFRTPSFVAPSLPLLCFRFAAVRSESVPHYASGMRRLWCMVVYGAIGDEIRYGATGESAKATLVLESSVLSVWYYSWYVLTMFDGMVPLVPEHLSPSGRGSSLGTWYATSCPASTRARVIGKDRIATLTLLLPEGSIRAIGLRACYAMIRTDIPYGSIGLRLCYAISGTDIGYAATRSAGRIEGFASMAVA
eukprot:3936143-Rhodomonas_salina.1